MTPLDQRSECERTAAHTDGGRDGWLVGSVARASQRQRHPPSSRLTIGPSRRKLPPTNFGGHGNGTGSSILLPLAGLCGHLCVVVSIFGASSSNGNIFIYGSV